MRSRILYLIAGVLLAIFPAAAEAHSSSGQGLEVTDTYVRAPSDEVPRLCNLAPPTHVSVADGVWSNPATWNSGTVPAAGARVHIAANTAVTYDADSSDVVQCIEVQDEGRFTFAQSRNTQLWLDDGILVMPLGVLEIGTADSPIAAGATAEIVFADTPLKSGTAANPGVDPQQYGKGLAVFGDVFMYGNAKSAYHRLARELRAGDTTLQLVETPTNWRVGDKLIVPDTRQIPFKRDHSYVSQAEEVIIQAASGNVITLSQPLQFDHLGPRDADGNQGPTEAAMYPHVGNMARNIVLRSENTEDVLRRGHAIFLHRADVDIRYAEFRGLGRTTIADLDNTTVDENGTITAIGTNQIGRYSMHLHHLWGPRNESDTGYQFEVVGTVMDDMLKWGMTIHDTHYGLIQDNIAYDGQGSAIATEDGNEAFNVFENNFVVHTKAGDTETLLAPDPIRGGVFNQRALFGTTRDCYWFSGEYNYVRNNVCANSPDFAYNYNGYYLTDPMRVPRFRGADMGVEAEYEEWNVEAPWQIDDPARQTQEGLPVLESAGNEAYGATGQGLWLTWGRGCCDVQHYKSVSLFEGYRLWHLNHTGVYAFHESRNTYRDFVLRNDPAISGESAENRRFNRGFWLGTAAYENGQLVVQDFDVQGFNVGVALPVRAEDGTDEENISLLENGFLKNHVNVQDFTPNKVDKKTVVRNVTFELVSAPDANVLPREPKNFWMVFDPIDAFVSLGAPLLPSSLYVYDFNNEAGNNFLVYFEEQTPDFVLPSHRNIPSELHGLTNEQAFTQFGEAIAGGVAPCVLADGDNCEAARGRAQTLNTLGLVFPFGGDQPSIPPRLTILQPKEGTSFESNSVPVQYEVSGDLADFEADHIHFKLDDNPEVQGIPLTGTSYTFEDVPAGAHTVTGFIARADHSQISGTQASVSFTTTEPEAPNVLPTLSFSQDTASLVATIGQMFTLEVTATDQDGDTIDLKAQDLPIGAVFQ